MLTATDIKRLKSKAKSLYVQHSGKIAVGTATLVGTAMSAKADIGTDVTNMSAWFTGAIGIAGVFPFNYLFGVVIGGYALKKFAQVVKIF